MKPYCNNKFRSVDIIIPFYKHEELVPPLFTSIFSCVEDLYVMNIRLVIINDSPGYKQLEVALENELEQCKRLQVNFKIIRNNENLGFVQSANKGLEQSMIASHDAILLNSDTILTPSALKEMQRVAYLDSMIGFVSPRSNNATIYDDV